MNIENLKTKAEADISEYITKKIIPCIVLGATKQLILLMY